MRNENIINRVFAGVAFLFSLIIYLKTIAPTVSFWDCGEFITCSYILGIPHPPGAPFYLLIGRIFSMIPFAQDIGLRVNFVSALSSAITVALLYLIIVRFIKQWRGAPKNSEDMLTLVASGMLGALAYAFSDTFWFNAVEAEVYAISMLFTSLIVWLMLVWLEKSDTPGHERYVLMMAYIVGLAIGVHLLMILALPALFLIVYFKLLERYNEKINLKNVSVFVIITGLVFAAIYPGIVKWVPMIAGRTSMWFFVVLIAALVGTIWYAAKANKRILNLCMMSFLLIVMGYSTYTMLYIRSNLNPQIDENDPETMEQMISYVNRDQYGTWGIFPRRFPGITPEWQFEDQYPGRSYATHQWDKQMDFMFNYQINKMYWRYFFWNFAGKGTTIGADGFIKEVFSLNKLLGLPFLIGLIGMLHHFYRHWRHASVVMGLFILTGLAIVIYLNQEDPQPRERDYVFVGSYFAFAIWLGMGLTAIIEWIQESFGKNGFMRKALTVAFIILFFIMAPVNMLRANYEDHDRTGNYVAYDYSYNILQSCEKDAIIFTNGDNDTFPLWFLQYVYGIRPDVRIVNLSLLNTPWYIKQLKNQEPKVPISYPDDLIDQLEIMKWEKQKVSIDVPPRTKKQTLDDLGQWNINMEEDKIPGKITFEVAPTVFGQALRVQDLMVLNILHANRWQKPVYFAVTVSRSNQLNLDNYLRMDGLAFKIVPYDVENQANIVEEKLEENLYELFQFRGLADSTVYLNDNIKGLLQNYRAAFMRLAYKKVESGDYKDVAAVFDKMDEVIPVDNISIPSPMLSLQIGQMYSLAGENDKFAKYAKVAYQDSQNDPRIVGTLISLYEREEMYDEAIEILEDWIELNPDDPSAKEHMEQLKVAAASAGQDSSDSENN